MTPEIRSVIEKAPVCLVEIQAAGYRFLKKADKAVQRIVAAETAGADRRFLGKVERVPQRLFSVRFLSSSSKTFMRICMISSLSVIQNDLLINDKLF